MSGDADTLRPGYYWRPRGLHEIYVREHWSRGEVLVYEYLMENTSPFVPDAPAALLHTNQEWAKILSLSEKAAKQALDKLVKRGRIFAKKVGHLNSFVVELLGESR